MYHNPRLRRPQINFNTRKLRTQYLNYRTNNYTSKRTRIGRGTKNVRKRFSKKNNLKFRQFGGGDICTICLEDDFSTNRNSWVQLPCTHCFHVSCINNAIAVDQRCPLCRVPLAPDFCIALAKRERVLNKALAQNIEPPPIELPLRIPEVQEVPVASVLPQMPSHQSQPIGQSSSFQRLPPRLNRETMSFHELRTIERRPRTFLSRPPVIQQPRILVHPPPRLVNISDPSDWTSLTLPSILYPGRRRRLPQTFVTVNI